MSATMQSNASGMIAQAAGYSEMWSLLFNIWACCQLDFLNPQPRQPRPPPARPRSSLAPP